MLSTELVNPDHEDPDIKYEDMTLFEPEVANRVPYMIRTLVYIWIVLVVIAICLITRKPRGRVILQQQRFLAQQQLKGYDEMTKDELKTAERAK